LEGIAKGGVSMFYEYLVYFTANWYILWTFGMFCGNLVYFPPFWYFVPRQIWQPCTKPSNSFARLLPKTFVNTGKKWMMAAELSSKK
jgi:hypothetical protein